MSENVTKIFEQAKSEGRKFLLEYEAKAVCQEYGIPVTKVKVSKNAEEAAEFSAQIGYPVVLKIVSPDVIHKFDVGGVILDVNSKEEAKNGF